MSHLGAVLLILIYSLQKDPGHTPALVFWTYEHVIEATKQSGNVVLMDELIRYGGNEPWETVWKHRKRIKSYSNPAALNAMHICLALMTGVYELRKKIYLGAQTAIPQLAVYAWMHSKDEHSKFYCRFAFATTGKYFRVDSQDATIDAVVEEYGPEEILRRFVVEIENRTGDEWRTKTQVQMIALVRLFAFHSQCVPHLEASGLIQAITARLRKVNDIHDHAWFYWALAAQVFIRVHEYHKAHGESMIGTGKLQPRQVGHVVVIGVTLYASGVDPKDEETHVSFLKRLFHIFSQRNQPESFYAHIADDNIDPLRFYHILLALQTLSSRTHGGPTRERNSRFVIDWWRAWGTDAGISEEAARLAYEQGRARFCGWSLCRYHVDPAPHALPSCKGCGKVSYCGKDCQVRDWKYGGHKQRCQRLKAS